MNFHVVAVPIKKGIMKLAVVVAQACNLLYWGCG